MIPTPEPHPRRPHPFPPPGFASQFCDVEVDPETGKVTVLRFVAPQDVGKAIHPSYVEGQIQGG
jgi:CO/xanthine dehydrogenase Mo-binding subunit